jgi:hypothetical protein
VGKTSPAEKAGVVDDVGIDGDAVSDAESVHFVAYLDDGPRVLVPHYQGRRHGILAPKDRAVRSAHPALRDGDHDLTPTAARIIDFQDLNCPGSLEDSCPHRFVRPRSTLP